MLGHAVEFACGDEGTPARVEGLISAFGAEAVAAWRDSEGQSALHLAAYCTRHGAGMLQQLIDAGMDVNARNKGGLTPFHLARSVEAVEVFLKAGAVFRSGNTLDTTPLHLALMSRHIQVARALILASNDLPSIVLFRDRFGYTPTSLVDYAVKGRDTDLAHLLKASVARAAVSV